MVLNNVVMQITGAKNSS